MIAIDLKFNIVSENDQLIDNNVDLCVIYFWPLGFVMNII